MAGVVDAIVIGAGPAGEAAAAGLAAEGLEVALIERELVGGECAFLRVHAVKGTAATRRTARGGPARARRTGGGDRQARPAGGPRATRRGRPRSRRHVQAPVGGGPRDRSDQRPGEARRRAPGPCRRRAPGGAPRGRARGRQWCRDPADPGPSQKSSRGRIAPARSPSTSRGASRSSAAEWSAASSRRRGHRSARR